jgi:hypothetical protein
MGDIKAFLKYWKKDELHEDRLRRPASLPCCQAGEIFEGEAGSRRISALGWLGVSSPTSRYQNLLRFPRLCASEKLRQ